MAQNTIQEDGTILRDARSRYLREHREREGAHGAFETEIRSGGGSPRVEVTVRREPAPTAIAPILGQEIADSSGLRSTEEVVVRERRMYDGGRLVQLASTWIPVDVAEAAGIEQEDTGVGGIISRMAEAGFAQAEVIEEVRLVSATEAEAGALGVAAGDKLMEITHVGYTETGRAVEVTRHLPSPGWTLRYSVPLD